MTVLDTHKRHEKGAWIWFCFTGEDQNKITKVKSQLSKSLISPKFDIHLTLAGPVPGNLENLKKSFDSSDLNIKKFEIKLDGYGYSSCFFESIYISIIKNEKLINARRECIKYFGLKNVLKEYNPHISLVYGDFEETKKKKSISRLPSLTGTISPSHICLAFADEVNLNWEIISKKLI